MKILEEFKKFAMQGNVIDLAVGIVIGGAFGKIVSSFVNDVLMPPIGLLIGGVNFTDLKFTLWHSKIGENVVTLNYGSFLQNVIDFLIIAFAIFMLVKGVNFLRKKEKEQPPAPPGPTAEEKLLTEIRDLLENDRTPTN